MESFLQICKEIILPNGLYLYKLTPDKYEFFYGNKLYGFTRLGDRIILPYVKTVCTENKDEWDFEMYDWRKALAH